MKVGFLSASIPWILLTANLVGGSAHAQIGMTEEQVRAAFLIKGEPGSGMKYFCEAFDLVPLATNWVGKPHEVTFGLRDGKVALVWILNKGYDDDVKLNANDLMYVLSNQIARADAGIKGKNKNKKAKNKNVKPAKWSLDYRMNHVFPPLGGTKYYYTPELKETERRMKSVVFDWGTGNRLYDSPWQAIMVPTGRLILNADTEMHFKTVFISENKDVFATYAVDAHGFKTKDAVNETIDVRHIALFDHKLFLKYALAVCLTEHAGGEDDHYEMEFGKFVPEDLNKKARFHRTALMFLSAVEGTALPMEEIMAIYLEKTARHPELLAAVKEQLFMPRYQIPVKDSRERFFQFVSDVGDETHVTSLVNELGRNKNEDRRAPVMAALKKIAKNNDLPPLPADDEKISAFKEWAKKAAAKQE